MTGTGKRNSGQSAVVGGKGKTITGLNSQRSMTATESINPDVETNWIGFLTCDLMSMRPSATLMNGAPTITGEMTNIVTADRIVNMMMSDIVNKTVLMTGAVTVRADKNKHRTMTPGPTAGETTGVVIDMVRDTYHLRHLDLPRRHPELLHKHPGQRLMARYWRR